MNTLFVKLSAALLLIITLMGVAFYIVDRINIRTYYEELSQTLNAPIAMYVNDQHQLIVAGEPDLENLRELAGQAMVLNPTAEIYLLDTEGRIVGHGLPEGTVLKDRVDLAPVLALINGSAHMPVRGDDPRSIDSRKVFSAAEVVSPEGLEGFLYVILGGQAYEMLANDIDDSYVGRMSAFAVAVIVLLTGIVGLLVFSLLTRRLKKLGQEMRLVSDSGFERTPAFGTSAMRGDEIDALMDAFVDMSARIKKQVERLKDNDRLRRELVSNISHDLRTPLAAMQGYLETLIIKADTISAEDRDKYLQVARKHTLRLGTLIGDLFELSKLDSAVTPSLESFSLSELAQDVAQGFQFESEQKGVDLALNLESESAYTVGDIGLIQRVLENLVRNAIRYTPEGGEVVISIAERPETVAVSVADNGAGISEEDIPRIFDRFYRALDGEEARLDSSGLGLAIVKRILDLHQSRITCASKLNTGTRFEFELPPGRGE